MANRPAFLVASPSEKFVNEAAITFEWHAGLSLAQKQRSIASLHKAIVELYPNRKVLEVSTKSEDALGRELSAFNLTLPIHGRDVSVESIFQASKVFEHGGPYTDLLEKSSREAKGDTRLSSSGKIIAFRFDGREFPIEPKTIFYDWIYTRAVLEKSGLPERIAEFDAFTDIEFNPQKSINCQARTCARIASVIRAGKIDTLGSFESFSGLY